MADSQRYSTDELLAIERGLDRSFMVCVAALLANLAVPFVVDAAPHPWGVAFLLASLVSTILMASPLSLKILLSRELRAKIHDKTFEG